MDEIWSKIYEFPEYSISSHGRVRNEARTRIIKTSLTRQGAVKVGLVKGGKQHTRSVKVLVAEAFVEGWTEQFDTSMHLDGNAENNRADNIVWRPRWFVWKYHRQFETIDKYVGVGPVADRKTGEIYPDIAQASMANGLLCHEVHLALVNKTPVFPSWRIFDWVREQAS